MVGISTSTLVALAERLCASCGADGVAVGTGRGGRVLAAGNARASLLVATGSPRGILRDPRTGEPAILLGRDFALTRPNPRVWRHSGRWRPAIARAMRRFAVPGLAFSSDDPEARDRARRYAWTVGWTTWATSAPARVIRRVLLDGSLGPVAREEGIVVHAAVRGGTLPTGSPVRPREALAVLREIADGEAQIELADIAARLVADDGYRGPEEVDDPGDAVHLGACHVFEALEGAVGRNDEEFRILAFPGEYRGWIARYLEIGYGIRLGIVRAVPDVRAPGWNDSDFGNLDGFRLPRDISFHLRHRFEIAKKGPVVGGIAWYGGSAVSARPPFLVFATVVSGALDGPMVLKHPLYCQPSGRVPRDPIALAAALGAWGELERQARRAYGND